MSKLTDMERFRAKVEAPFIRNEFGLWCPNCGEQIADWEWVGDCDCPDGPHPWIKFDRAIEAAEADLLGRCLEALRVLRPANLGRVPESMRDDETLPVDMTIREIRMIDAILSQAREVK